MEWAARAIGLFYIVAGVMALRQAIFNWRMERVFGAFLETPPAEKAADAMLTGGAVLVLLSGLSLAALRFWAPITFLAAWASQAIYLLWAARWYRPENEELAKLRRQTTNAFYVYTAATAWVVWLGWRGVLV